MNPEELIQFLQQRADQFLLNSIQKLARRLRPASTTEDVVHEAVLRMLPKLARFEPARGDPDAFLSLAVFRCLASIFRDHRAAKRFIKNLDSLQDLVTNPDGHPQRLEQTVDDRADRRVPRTRRSQAEQTEMQIDLAEAIESLPLELRLIAERLGQMNIKEIAEELGLGRTTVHARISRIRQRFEKAHLRQYL